jgi:hypothetical protein
VLQNLGHEYKIEAVIREGQRHWTELDPVRFETAITTSPDRHIRDVATHHMRTRQATELGADFAIA